MVSVTTGVSVSAVNIPRQPAEEVVPSVSARRRVKRFAIFMAVAVGRWGDRWPGKYSKWPPSDGGVRMEDTQKPESVWLEFDNQCDQNTNTRPTATDMGLSSS